MTDLLVDDPREPSGRELTERARRREVEAKRAADRPAIERTWRAIEALLREQRP